MNLYPLNRTMVGLKRVETEQGIKSVHQTLNRTMVGLKHLSSKLNIVFLKSLNRTMVGLKLNFPVSINPRV